MEWRPCDEFATGFGWVVRERMERASHALVRNGDVWLIDPVAVDGVEERARAAGRPAGIIQLLDRHGRDCATLARRLGVAHHVVPREGSKDAPFEFRTVVNIPGWREVALWWPEQRVLACGDALGTAAYFLAARERLAVHPLLRLLPPRDVALDLAPRHVLCGHGEGIHGEEAALELDKALATARRRVPRWLVTQVRWRR